MPQNDGRDLFRKAILFFAAFITFHPALINTASGQLPGGFKIPKIGKESIPTSLGCGTGALLGAEIGKKFADSEAKRLKLPPAQAAAQRKKYEIGLAMALCGGGQAVAGTTYAKLSKHGQDARNKELQSALMDEAPAPHMYKDPDNPQLNGTLMPEMATTQGNQECKVIEDSLADGSQNDSALIKYCRVPPDGMWKVQSA